LSITTVIFDLDGTLIDSLPLTFQAFREATRPFLNRDLTDEEIYARFGPADHEIVAGFVPPRHASEAVRRLMAAYEEGMDLIRFYPGIHGLVRDMRGRGLRLALCTGRGRPSTEVILRHHGVASWFEAVVTGEDVPRPKPFPDGILETCRRMGVAPAEVLYTGDSIKDVEAGLAAGAFTVAALWAGTEGRTGFEKAHAAAETPSEILGILDDRSGGSAR
jgi:phosphoglycolate phosphatase/pyrophosphatase PpaX